MNVHKLSIAFQSCNNLSHRSACVLSTPLLLKDWLFRAFICWGGLVVCAFCPMVVVLREEHADAGHSWAVCSSTVRSVRSLYSTTVWAAGLSLSLAQIDVLAPKKREEKLSLTVGKRIGFDTESEAVSVWWTAPFSSFAWYANSTSIQEMFAKYCSTWKIGHWNRVITVTASDPRKFKQTCTNSKCSCVLLVIILH